MSMKEFKVEMLLGKGSYGAVYKCKRKRDGQRYALKEVNIQKLSHREREDAVNEIRILASITHRNIVRYCEAFIEKDNLYIVMQFAEMGDIGHVIKKHKQKNKYIKEQRVWSYFIQCATALQLLHGQGIIHRDLKPKNIFLTTGETILIGDFGCSKLVKARFARTQIGTPYYMSPEIWNRRPYDMKSDVWALGCILYEMCQLTPPFLANDMEGLAHKVRTSAAPRISRHYSSDLASLVARMMHKNPSSRPTIDEIMLMSCVQQRTHVVPTGDLGRWEEDERSKLLATIKVPRNMPRRRGNVLALPKPRYPDVKAFTSPAGGHYKAKSRSTPTKACTSPIRPATSPAHTPLPPGVAEAAAARGKQAAAPVARHLASRARGTRTPSPVRCRRKSSQDSRPPRQPVAAPSRGPAPPAVPRSRASDEKENRGMAAPGAYRKRVLEAKANQREQEHVLIKARQAGRRPSGRAKPKLSAAAVGGSALPSGVAAAYGKGIRYGGGYRQPPRRAGGATRPW